MILAIDQSYSGTGVCYISSDGRIEAALIRTKPSMSWESRIDFIIDNLDAFFNLSSVTMDNPSPVEYVVLESYAFSRATSSVFQLGELGGIIKYHFHKKGVDVATMLIAHPKMFIALNGQADKKEVINGLKTRYGIEVKDDNIADAIAIGLTYYNYLIGNAENRELAPYFRTVLRKVENYMKKEKGGNDGKNTRRSAKSKKKPGKGNNRSIVSIRPEDF